MPFKKYFSIVFFFLISFTLFGQKENIVDIDSLLQKDFKELRVQFFDTENSDAIAGLYADAYLKKAKQRKDSKKTIDGYYYKSLLHSDSLRIVYIDSLIQLSKKRVDNYLIENALVIKAADYYTTRSYKKALNLYIEAQQYAQKSNNDNTLFSIEYNIGVIYNLIGFHESGLKTFKKSLKRFQSLDVPNEERELTIITSIVASYRQLGVYDSMTYYTNKGIKQTHKQQKFENLYNLFLLNEGIRLYFTKQYSGAIDSIQKTVPHFKSTKNDSKLSYAYFYLGRSHLATHHTKEAIDYLKKVDTIFLKTNYLFPETRATYELLIDHYKKKKDLHKQLLYIERLLRLDSIIHDKELYLTKHISEDYNTPRLIADKQQIIQSLRKKENFYVTGMVIALIVIILAIGFVCYQNIQRKKYKKRFEELLKAQEETKQHTIIDVSDQKQRALNIPEDIVNTVLKSLADFKEKNEFLATNVTLQKLAKRFKTNHTYLSKIINVYEGQSFNTFVNDLRISYAMKRLQTDAVFRKYTIDAIAEESGFSNTRTFFKSFSEENQLKSFLFYQKPQRFSVKFVSAFYSIITLKKDN